MAPTTQICRRSARIGRKAVGLVVELVELVVVLVVVAVGLVIDGAVGAVIAVGLVVGVVGLFSVTAFLACAIFFTRRITLLTSVVL